MIDSREYPVGVTYLGQNAAPRMKASWAFPTGAAGMRAVVVVCPAGHRTHDVGPSRATYRCERCGRDWEIEA